MSWRPTGDVDARVYIFSTTALGRVRMANTTLDYPWESPGTYFTGGWVDPRTSLDTKEQRKISTLPLPGIDPEPSSSWSSAIWPTLFISTCFYFRISDLVKIPDGTVIQPNPSGEFRWSPESPISQIPLSSPPRWGPWIFSDLLRSVQMLKRCGKQREATTPIYP